MHIRSYQPADLNEITRLFYETVHTINTRDYTAAQCSAWAPDALDLVRWGESLAAHIALVAFDASGIIGFGDIDDTGYLDRLYVHKNHQGQGVATALCDALEQAVSAQIITTEASITAKPFFEKRGYTAILTQNKPLRGEILTNFVMKKQK